MKMKNVLSAALLVCAAGTAGASASDGYPNKPVKLILPFPTGATFVVGQTLAEVLTKELGEVVVVENRSGAGGRIAMEHVANAKADGYTLLLTSPTLTITPAIDSSLPFDPLKDLVPVARVAEVPNVFVVNPKKFGNLSFQELQAQIKNQPAEFTYGSGGAGSSNHLAFEKFRSLTSADIRHIPFRGASQAVTSAVGGMIDMVINGLPNSVPLIKSKQLKAMFVLTPERQPLLPDVPSAVEVGLPDMVVTTWYGVLAPAGTDSAIIEKISHAIQRGLANPDVKQRLANGGVDAVYEDSSTFAHYIKTDFEMWKNVVADAGIVVQN